MCVKRTGPAISPWRRAEQGAVIIAGAEWDPLLSRTENLFVTCVLSSRVSVPPGVCASGVLPLISAPQRAPTVAHSVGSSTPQPLLPPPLQNIQFHNVALFLPAEFAPLFFFFHARYNNATAGRCRSLVDWSDTSSPCRMARTNACAPVLKEPGLLVLRYAQDTAIMMSTYPTVV